MNSLSYLCLFPSIQLGRHNFEIIDTNSIRMFVSIAIFAVWRFEELGRQYGFSVLHGH
uniref:Uncharacterized protein n=1 Tax=Lepeophtheirus salmonis TaxID=72036 RepID=A0A0K2U684_LEPSM